jgi:hypothetical protein
MEYALVFVFAVSRTHFTINVANTCELAYQSELTRGSEIRYSDWSKHMINAVT